MGFLYGAMDLTIDEKWEYQLHQHLHVVAYFLSPHFQYDDNFSNHPEIKLGLYTCMDKFIVDQVERNKANIHIDAFRKKEGHFGFQQAKATCKTSIPGKLELNYEVVLIKV